MRRSLTPFAAPFLGLVLGLVGCSGDSPTSPTPGGGGGGGGAACGTTVSVAATAVSPLAGSAVILRATVKNGTAAVPDGTSVVFTTDFGIFLETLLPSVSKVTQNGFADVTLGSTTAGTANVRATSSCGSGDISIQWSAIPQFGPYVSSMTPNSGTCRGGDSVSIQGGGFLTALNTTPRVTFGGAPATVTAATKLQINLLTPARTLANNAVPETVDVVVTVDPATAAATSTAPVKFTYTCLANRIAVSSVSPNTGRTQGNEPVVVGGANFGTTAATTRVTFGGVPGGVTAVNGSTINVTTPAHTLTNPAIPETVDVGVTIDLGLVTQQSAVLPQSFTYFQTGPGAPCNVDPRLFISQVVVPLSSSTSGSTDGGDIVTINGGGFWFGNPAQPVPMSRVKVEFGGVQGVVTNWGDTSLTVVTPRFTLTNPDAPQSVEVKVTVDVGGSREACSTTARAYTYFPTTYLDPFITSMSPSTGPNDASTRVTLFGKNFRFPSQVFVGTAEATVVSITSSQIVFMTPTATSSNSGMAGTSQLVVVRDTYSGKTATSPVSFHYYPCPTAALAAPATAPWNASTAVTISGNGFEEPVEAVFIYQGLVQRLNVVSVSSGFIVVQMPPLDQIYGTGNIPCGDIGGSINLTFPSLACNNQVGVSFTYQINRPTITFIQPQTAVEQLVGGTVFTVTGTGFSDPMSVTVGGAGGVTVKATYVNPTTLTFVAPVLPNSVFQEETCVPIGGTSANGRKYVPTWLSIQVSIGRTTCTAQLPSAVKYNPADTTCRAPLLVSGVPVQISGTVCTPVPLGSLVGVFTVSGGTPPYAITPPTLPAFLTYALSPAPPATNTVTVTGTGLAPTLSAPGPGTPSTLITYMVRALDSVGQTADKTFSFTVSDPGAPMIASIPTIQSIPSGAAGGDGPTMTVSGVVSPYTWIITDVQPVPGSGGFTTPTTGPTTAVIRAAAGTTSSAYSITVTVTDNLGCAPKHTVSAVVSMTVGP